MRSIIKYIITEKMLEDKKESSHHRGCSYSLVEVHMYPKKGKYVLEEIYEGIDDNICIVWVLPSKESIKRHHYWLTTNLDTKYHVKICDKF